jgi:hypothetical protein
MDCDRKGGERKDKAEALEMQTQPERQKKNKQRSYLFQKKTKNNRECSMVAIALHSCGVSSTIVPQDHFLAFLSFFLAAASATNLPHIQQDS